MDQALFRKTDRGRQALQGHDKALDSRSRNLLILCNGRTPMAELRKMIGGLTDALLQGLLARGLVERAVQSAAEHACAPPKARPPTAAQAQPVPDMVAVVDLRTAKRRELELLESLFGPGGGSHGQAVLQAHDAATFEQALTGVHDAISIYQGKKRAALLMQQIRSGP
ncbi:MAG: hypothetical protein ACOZJZ_15920 [Pseudomonadota bacterium]